MRTPAMSMAAAACLGPVFSCDVLYNQLQKGCARPRPLQAGALSLGTHPTPPQGPPPLGPHPPSGGWEGPVGLSQLPVPGNAGLSSAGWNLAHSQEVVRCFPSSWGCSPPASRSPAVGTWAVADLSLQKLTNRKALCTTAVEEKSTRPKPPPCPPKAAPHICLIFWPLAYLSSFPHPLLYFYYCRGQALTPQDWVTGPPLHWSTLAPWTLQAILTIPPHPRPDLPLATYVSQSPLLASLSQLPNSPPGTPLGLAEQVQAPCPAPPLLPAAPGSPRSPPRWLPCFPLHPHPFPKAFVHFWPWCWATRVECPSPSGLSKSS